MPAARRRCRPLPCRTFPPPRRAPRASRRRCRARPGEYDHGSAHGRSRHSRRIAAGECSRNRSSTRTRLPVDFAIFASPMRTVPARNHARANGVTPVAASASAASHAWCGYARSAPPACRSTVGPNSASTIAAHSACQPGRPSPHGLGQLISSGAVCCHTAVSSGSSLSAASGWSWYSADSRSAVSRDSPASSATEDVRAYTVPPRRYARSRASSAAASWMTWPTAWVAVGEWSGTRTRSASIVASNAAR